MDITEKDLEDLIWNASKTLEGQRFLKSRGLPVDSTMFRQVGLGNFGVADMVGVLVYPRQKQGDFFVRDCFIDIYELKRNEIGIDALGQAVRYAEGILYFLNNSSLRIKPHVIIHLIGSKIAATGEFIALAKAVGNVHLYQYEFRYDGLFFRHILPDTYHYASPGKPSKKAFSFKGLKAVMGFQQTFEFNRS